MENERHPHEGHRERLRVRFRENPALLEDAGLLELLLTFAIPRRDVAPLAESLLQEFGTLDAILTLSSEELGQVEGIGESARTLLELVKILIMKNTPLDQLSLFEQELPAPGTRERGMRILANNEVENALKFLPQAVNFQNGSDLRSHLIEQLPYNSIETRRRRARYILDRFFPGGNLNTPLLSFLANEPAPEALKAVVFYHMLKAEPLAAKAAEELVFPALPLGKIERGTLREFTLGYFPEASQKSLNETLLSFYTIYRLLGVGVVSDETLRFNLRAGNADAFAYILCCEFPQAGIYSFDLIFNGPPHRWLLWDRDWIRRQLYNLLDLGVLAKVSEIDAMRQFTLTLSQTEALRRYFEQSRSGLHRLRETQDGLSD